MRRYVAPAAWCVVAVLVVLLLLSNRRSPIGTPSPQQMLPPGVTQAQAVALAHIARGSSFEPLRSRPGKGSFEAAMAEYRKALKADPGNRMALSALASCQHRAGKDAEAIRLWKSLATVADDEGRRARKWLRKVGASP